MATEEASEECAGSFSGASFSLFDWVLFFLLFFFSFYAAAELSHQV